MGAIFALGVVLGGSLMLLIGAALLRKYLNKNEPGAWKRLKTRLKFWR